MRITICAASFRVLCRSTVRGSVIGRARKVVGRVVRGGRVRFRVKGCRNVKVIFRCGKGSCVIATTTCSNCNCSGLIKLRRALVYLFVVKLSLLFVTNCILTGLSLGPVEGVIGRTRAVATSRVSHHVPIGGRGSRLNRLAVTFGRLLGQLRVSFGSRGRFIDGISRRLHAPLTTLATRVSISLRGRQAGRRCRLTVRGVRRSTGQVAQLVSNLLGLTGTSCNGRRVDVQRIHLSRLLLSTERLVLQTRPRCDVSLLFYGRRRSSSDLVAILNGPCLLGVTFSGLVRGGYGCSRGRSSVIRVSFESG